MAAERLYYNSPDLNFTATVTDIRLVSVDRAENGEKTQLWQVALDRTAFYPESGGQPWDLGTLTAVARSGAVLEVPVERVEEDEAGEVWHSIRKPLIQGTDITGRIDAARRADHMQQHTGQHLLSAVFLQELGASTVSFHLGAETSTIDLQLPPGMSRLEPADVERVEAAANRLIFEDRLVAPLWRTREQAEEMLADGRLRKLPDREGPLRVMAIAGLEFNACGGTHVGATGSIGGLLVRKIEKGKGGAWRVEFVCGQRAVKAARRDFGLLSGVAGTLSVGAGEVPGRVASLLAEVKREAKQNLALLGEIAQKEVVYLHQEVAPDALVEACYAGRDANFLSVIAASLQRLGRDAVLSAQEDESGIVMLVLRSDSPLHAGDLVKEFLRRPGLEELRGGGSATMAQFKTGSSANFYRAGLAAVVRDRLGLPESTRSPSESCSIS